MNLYVSTMNNVIDYIEDNITEPLTLESKRVRMRATDRIGVILTLL